MAERKEKLPRSIPLTVEENVQLVALYLLNKVEYNAKFFGGSKNGPSPQDKLAREWAIALSGTSGVPRSLDKIKRRILDMRTEARKHYAQEKVNMNNTGSGATKAPNYPVYYKPLIEDIGTEKNATGLPKGTETSPSKESSSPSLLENYEELPTAYGNMELENERTRKRSHLAATPSRPRTHKVISEADELTKYRNELLAHEQSNAREKGEILAKKSKYIDRLMEYKERKLAFDERKLAFGERKLAFGERKLDFDERKLSFGERKLDFDERKMALEEAKLAAEENNLFCNK